MPLFESREVPFTVAEKVGILVHPLSVTRRSSAKIWTDDGPDTIERHYQFLGSRKNFFLNAVNHFAPKKQGEYLLFMPKLNFWEEPGDAYVMEKYKNRDEEIEQWPHLLEYLQKHAAVKNNIIVVNDITAHDSPFLPVNELLLPLKVRNVAITPETEVTLGGEWLNACLTNVALEVLKLPQIHHINIDLNATLNKSTYENPDDRLEEIEFMNTMRKFGYSVEEKSSVLMVRKI